MADRGEGNTPPESDAQAHEPGDPAVAGARPEVGPDPAVVGEPAETEPEPGAQSPAVSDGGHGDERMRPQGEPEGLDVMDAPLEQGADPLSDGSLDHRAQGPRAVQMAFFGVLAVVFAYLLVIDVAHHSWGRALLGVIVVAVCALALVREMRGQGRG